MTRDYTDLNTWSDEECVHLLAHCERHADDHRKAAQEYEATASLVRSRLKEV